MPPAISVAHNKVFVKPVNMLSQKYGNYSGVKQDLKWIKWLKKLTKILLVPKVELILTKSSHFCCPQKGLCQASKHTEPKIWTLIQWCETGLKMDQVPKKLTKISPLPNLS